MVEIPARTLFVWTGRRFPYFARLAIESALLADRDVTVELHVFGEPPTSAPHVSALLRYDRFSIHEIDEARVFDGLGVDARALRETYARIPRGAASARSNLLRYALLARRGGVYVDTDALVVRSLRDLRHHEAFAGQEQVLSIDADRVAGRWSARMIAPAAAWAGAWLLRRAAAAARVDRLEPLARRLDPYWQLTQLNNAVLGARPGARFLRRVLARALEVDPRVRYGLGPTLVSEVARASAADVALLPPVAFYSVPPSASFRFFTGGPWPIPAEARVLHVVASNHARELATLDEDTLPRRARLGPYYAAATQVARAARDLPRASARPAATGSARR
jgi:hypothetical protein